MAADQRTSSAFHTALDDTDQAAQRVLEDPALDEGRRVIARHVAATSDHLRAQVADLPPDDRAWLLILPALGEPFRAALQALQGYAALLASPAGAFARPPAGGATEDALDQLHQAALAVVAAVTRIQAAASALRVAERDRPPGFFDLSAMIRENGPVWRFWLRDQPVRLEVSPGEDLPPIWGSAYHLAALVQHLVLTTAIELIAYGTIRIQAGVTDGGVALRVFCTGIRLTQAELATLFEQEYRHLYLERLASLGGQLQLERRRGTGSTFVITLPDHAGEAI
jgi:signal transduction histidine kinase